MHLPIHFRVPPFPSFPIYLCLLSCLIPLVSAQASPVPRSPDEVLLVYNANSPTSKAIASYYKLKRHITHVLAVRCSDSSLNSDNETISLSDYTTEIANPVSTYLLGNGSINFIVLTKGIPIRVDGGTTGSQSEDQSPQDYQPSLDSYLAALDYSTLVGVKKASIAGSGCVGAAWVNRYYNSNVPFTHAQFGGYLVTRLDGYTEADAKALVDRALAAEAQLSTGPVVLDVEPDFGLGDKTTEPIPSPSTKVTSEESYDHWNADMLNAGDIMDANGIPHDTAITTTFVGNQGNLLGYFSWGSNDDHYDVPSYESLRFAPGAIGDTAVSSGMRTFIGDYAVFNSIDLTGATSLQARVANVNTSGSQIFQIRLDSPGGPIIGTCTVPSTGGFQTWKTVVSPLISGVTGIHDVYLVFVPNGFGGTLYNLQWITFHGASGNILAASSQLLSGGTYLENCSEGGQDLANISNGNFALYRSIRVTGMTSFQARVASDGSGGALEVHQDSPTGKLLGSCTVPITGGWQTWTNVTCPIIGASGIHDIYLVFTGGGGNLFNLEWFSFLGRASIIEVANCNTLSGSGQLETCSEGGQDLGGLYDGQSIMGDLIADGITGAAGYTNEPTLNAITSPTIDLSHYQSGYTLAESFYAGMPYVGWETIIVGDPLCCPYAGANALALPVRASSYANSAGGVSTESCQEGGLDVAFIQNGCRTVYRGLALDGVKTFQARVASGGPGGNIEVRLDSANGTLLGTCTVPSTGDWQGWTTVSCLLTSTTGSHNVYLVYTGGGGYLFNIQWFALVP